MKRYKLLGLTGRTGSGKSLVRDFFEKKGYKIIDADLLARKAIKDRIVQNNIASVFGADLFENGEINRKKLAERAFKNETSVKKLNSVIHPAITVLFLEEIKKLAENGETEILFDAPQLFEAKLDIICDCIIAVGAEESLRIKRIVKRDNISEKMAEERLKIQFPDSFFKKNSDFYIENNNSEKELKAKLEDIISRI